METYPDVGLSRCPLCSKAHVSGPSAFRRYPSVGPRGASGVRSESEDRGQQDAVHGPLQAVFFYS